MAKASNPLETPMMRQYLATKAEHPDCLLFMRMGDFFELFLDDAVTAHELLGITLTARNKGAEIEVPMAGVPHHSLDQHLPKLLAAGKKVAIMDQLQDPEEAKGLVERGLTRIITAGTLIDEDALDGRGSNLLVSVTALEGTVGIAALDVSTGRFTVEEATGANAIALALARLQPVEVVVPEGIAADQQALARLEELFDGSDPAPISALAAHAWRGSDAARYLAERLRVTSLDGFGIHPEEEHLAAAGAAALRYAGEQSFSDLRHVRSVTRLHHGDHLVLDATCRRNLDLIRNSRDGQRQGSLLAAVDATRTAPGARLLADWLARPLAHLERIAERHEAVAWLVDRDGSRDRLREQLKRVYDMERLLARIATGRCHARDLVQLSTTLEAAAACQEPLQDGDRRPLLIEAAATRLDPCPDLAAAINEVLVDDPPLAISEGGIVRDGIDQELDDLRSIKRDAGTWLADYQAREAEQTGLPKVKVGYNKVFGYFIEIGKAHSHLVPDSYTRKQTLVNAERYITPELKEYEDKVLGAEDRIRAREKMLFDELRDAAEAELASLQDTADSLAELDVLAGFAHIARTRDWCRPRIDDSRTLHVASGRHPVVEQVVGRGSFVPNDVHLDAHQHAESGRLGVITGPNMAGKSTYIRQVALAVILAQAGAFVPAESAHIGIVDRIFTRVGAGDELARNMSTFMVEMAETAAILNHAGNRSLVILDEVGRGTSTFDGLSLAWAITEHLHDRTGCRCLFATHYHELTDIAHDREGVHNLTVAVAEQDDDVVFLHRIVAGAATKSYGIHVARLAGVPRSVITRAREVLESLEQLNVGFSERERPAARREDPSAVQLDFLSAPTPSPTLGKLRALDLDDLSPRQAWEALHELQSDARKEE